MDIRVGVLGPMTATVAERDVSLGGLRQRAVLAVLVAARGRMVTADTLIADAWGEEPVPSAATLHSYVGKLRKALEPGRAVQQPARILVREGTGYALRLPAESVDAERFTALVARGQSLLDSGDPADAAGTLRRALALWRGPAYAEFSDAGFAAPEAARLDGLRLAAYEDLYTAELALGRHSAVVGDLTKHTAEHPLSERGWELLALALYRAGRQGDALGVLRAARRTLADELGIGPGPALRRLEASLLAQDSSVAAPPSALLAAPPAAPLAAPAALTGAPSPGPVPAAPPATARGPRQQEGTAHGTRGGNLPVPLSGMVGRAGELATVGALLRDRRLVTLTGPAGIGKTRLAIEAVRARDDVDGPWLIELAGLHNPELLPETVAAALGVPAPRGAAALAELLRERHTLLILDGCEHLVDAVAELVARLLAACPLLRILATSQEALGLDEEGLHEVPPLSAGEDGEAVALFLDRATRAVPDLRLDAAEREALAGLCAELDGMPLAIELAAAQCRVLSVRQMAAHLDDRFSLLGAARRGHTRHTTLLAAVTWSFNLLTPEERELLDALSVFEGGFALDAARQVTGRDDIVAHLGRLAAKSLVTVSGGDPRRYRIPETLRQYAVRHAPEERLQEAARRHLEWATHLAEEAYEGLCGSRGAEWMRRLGDEIRNIRAALDTAARAKDAARALRIATGVSGFWYRRGQVTEGLRHLEPAVADAAAPADGASRPEVRDHALLARAAGGYAQLQYLDGRGEEALAALHRAGFHAALADDREMSAWVMATTSRFEALAGLPGPARRRATRAVELARACGSRRLVAEALMCLGAVEAVARRPDEAAAHLEAALAEAETCGYALVASTAQWCLAKTEIDRGRPDLALSRVLSLVERAWAEADATFWLLGVATLATALFRLGHVVRAAELSGVVAGIGAGIGVSPQAMDPDGLGRYAVELSAGTDASVYARAAECGGRMSQDEAMELIRAHQRTEKPATGLLRPVSPPLERPRLTT